MRQSSTATCASTPHCGRQCRSLRTWKHFSSLHNWLSVSAPHDCSHCIFACHVAIFNSYTNVNHHRMEEALGERSYLSPRASAAPNRILRRRSLLLAAFNGMLEDRACLGSYRCGVNAAHKYCVIGCAIFSCALLPSGKLQLGMYVCMYVCM